MSRLIVQLVQVRGFDPGVTMSSHWTVSLIIGHDQDDIGFCLGCFLLFLVRGIGPGQETACQRGEDQNGEHNSGDQSVVHEGRCKIKEPEENTTQTGVCGGGSLYIPAGLCREVSEISPRGRFRVGQFLGWTLTA